MNNVQARMKHKAAILGLWGVLWRATVLFPVSVLFLFVLCGAFVLLVYLPIMAVLYAWSSDWRLAAAVAVGRVPVVAFLRWWWRRERSENNWGPL